MNRKDILIVIKIMFLSRMLFALGNQRNHFHRPWLNYLLLSHWGATGELYWTETNVSIPCMYKRFADIIRVLLPGQAQVIWLMVGWTCPSPLFSEYLLEPDSMMLRLIYLCGKEEENGHKIAMPHTSHCTFLWHFPNLLFPC